MYKVIFRDDGSGKPYKIVKNRKIVASSKTASDANKSIQYRVDAEREKQ